jgi:transposase-like protein
VSFTRGQLNAVRAAFKAGITPARIARQFGLSPSQVRKALATEASKGGHRLIKGDQVENPHAAKP